MKKLLFFIILIYSSCKVAEKKEQNIIMQPKRDLYITDSLHSNTVKIVFENKKIEKLILNFKVDTISKGTGESLQLFIVENGKRYEFYDTGTIKRICEIYNGQRVGEWIYFNKYGAIDSVITYPAR
jgi:antitoxin component YwqK of YwqJK toxin-antitoxin module